MAETQVLFGSGIFGLEPFTVLTDPFAYCLVGAARNASRREWMPARWKDSTSVRAAEWHDKWYTGFGHLQYINFQFAKAGKMEEALDLLSVMVSNGPFPDTATYKSLAYAICRGGGGDGNIGMLCSGCMSDQSTNVTLLGALAYEGLSAEAKTTF
ncbi:hypothetical protein U9M48_023093, partial [Paspalum notatum var. saurae]